MAMLNMTGVHPCMVSQPDKTNSRGKSKAWTREEYMIKSIRYSCLIPKNSCEGVDVEDLIKVTLHLHGIKNMAGVISCCTTYAQLKNQRIFNLEVAEALANMQKDPQ